LGSYSKIPDETPNLGVTDGDETAIHLIKGIAMDTVRQHFPEAHGEEAFARLLATLPEEIRAAFVDAQLDRWYPEEYMGAFFHAVYEQLAGRDEERFLEIVRANMVAGVSRFMRVLLSLASAKFVLKKLPTVFTHVRQSTARVTPAIDGDQLRIRYENFPFCRDRIYRLLSLGNCQALAQVASKQVPSARVLEWGPDWMTLEFDLPSKKRAREAEAEA
jgi:hypothetical protein